MTERKLAFALSFLGGGEGEITNKYKSQININISLRLLLVRTCSLPVSYLLLQVEQKATLFVCFYPFTCYDGQNLGYEPLGLFMSLDNFPNKISLAIVILIYLITIRISCFWSLDLNKQEIVARFFLSSTELGGCFLTSQFILGHLEGTVLCFLSMVIT